MTIRVIGNFCTVSKGTLFNVANNPIPSEWPDSTNTGYTNAPAYSGFLTPWNYADTTDAGNTYTGYDFEQGWELVAGEDNVTFVGCRFQSNSVGFFNFRTKASNSTFRYCSFTPLVTLAAAPPVIAWPSAGAGTDVSGGESPTAPLYMIGGNDGYQFGIICQGTGTTLIENCDVWGFGNAITFYGTNTKILRDSWIHDAANPDPQGYHTDGPGYLDGTDPANNVTIDHCTIASIGNTNAIAFQDANSPYINIIVNNCYLSGFNTEIDMCHSVAGSTGLQFTNNVLATDLRWHFSNVLNCTSTFTDASNLWRGNVLQVYPGSSCNPATSEASQKWVTADDGKFVYPDGTYHTTDFE